MSVTPERDERCPCCGIRSVPLPYRGFAGLFLPTCPNCHRIMSGEHEGKLLRVSPIGVAYWHADDAFERGTPGQRQLCLFPPPAVPGIGGKS